MSANIFLGVLIVLLVAMEWRYRAKRDGRKSAAFQMLHGLAMGGCLIHGVHAHSLLFLGLGMLLLIALVGGMMYTQLRRCRPDPKPVYVETKD